MRLFIASAVLALCACGDNDQPPSWGIVGPLTPLPMLDDFNHSSEVSIAAFGDHVVVSTIYQRFDSADTFELPQMGGLPRQVAISTSHDRGTSFGPPTPQGPASSDPVVVAGADGRFWSAVLTLVEGDGIGIVARSDDSGDYDGRRLGEVAITEPNWNAVGGHVDSDGVSRFLTVLPGVVRWDGVTAVVEGPLLDAGDQANVWTIAVGSIGMSMTGDQWLVRAVRRSTGASVVLTLETAMGERVDRPISAEGETAFLPAATLDEMGRLHVVYYDSSASRGVLRYTRSVDARFSAWLPSIVIDRDACPGDDWHPYSSNESPPGGRRLREYIGIAVVGERAHIAWMHAPEPPSQVHVTTVDENAAAL